MVLLVSGFFVCFCFSGYLSVFNFIALWLVNVACVCSAWWNLLKLLILMSDQPWWMFQKCLKSICILCWIENSTWISIRSNLEILNSTIIFLFIYLLFFFFALWKKYTKIFYWHCDFIMSLCPPINVYFLFFKVTLLSA